MESFEGKVKLFLDVEALTKQNGVRLLGKF
jgi:hypothetical protein